MKKSMVERMGNEDEMADWLEDNNVEISREAVETFTEFGFTSSELEKVGEDVGADGFAAVLEWLENLLGSKKNPDRSW
jgi:hypothetical protein